MKIHTPANCGPGPPNTAGSGVAAPQHPLNAVLAADPSPNGLGIFSKSPLPVWFITCIYSK